MREKSCRDASEVSGLADHPCPVLQFLYACYQSRNAKDIMQLAPLSARSVALSVLLGAPERGLPVRDLVATGAMCDIAPQTMRVALSRLVSSGELSVEEGVYTLAPHHLGRLRAQHEDIAP